jgi:iron complex transport system substrate-binding protein
MRTFTQLCLVLLIFSSIARAQDAPRTLTDARGQTVTLTTTERLASGSGDLTEIIYALGLGAQLVGVDRSSTYPPEALQNAADIGFARRLSAEPILDSAPDVFFCTQTCSPPEVFSQLEAVGLPVVIVPDSEDGGLDLPFPKIALMAEALGRPDEGARLAERVAREILWAQIAVANVDAPPVVFHLYSRGTGLQLAVGAGTPADAMIRGAGGINGAAEVGVTGYADLSPEIILSVFPDVLLLTEGNVRAAGGLEAILASPAFQATPAVQEGRIIVMDTQFLLGMSVRTGQALLALAAQLHPEMTWEMTPAYPYTVMDEGGQSIRVNAPRPIYATDAALRDLARLLGFHAELYTPDAPAEALILTSDPVQAAQLRGQGLLVLTAQAEVETLAQALGVTGRGAALLAWQAAQP